MKELELQGKSKPKYLLLGSSKTSDVTKNIRLLPPFLHLNQDNFPLSQKHILLSQVQNPTPVIDLIIPVIHLLQNPDFLVKINVKVPYPSRFEIIVNNQAISYLNVYLWNEREGKKDRRVLSLQVSTL